MKHEALKIAYNDMTKDKNLFFQLFLLGLRTRHQHTWFYLKSKNERALGGLSLYCFDGQLLQYVLQFQIRLFSQVDMWRQVGNYCTQALQELRGNGLWGCHSNESILTQTVWTTPYSRCFCPPPPHIYAPPFEVKWTRYFFFLSAITQTHHAVSLSFLLRVAWTRSDNGQKQSLWHSTGNKCLDARGAPSCAFPEGHQPPIQPLCVFHLSSNTLTLEIILSQSSPSHTSFSLFSLFQSSVCHSLSLLCFYWLWKTMEFC